MIGRRVGVRVAAVLGAIVLGVLSVRSMAVDYLSRTSPASVARLFPNSEAAVLQRTPMEGILRGPASELDGQVRALRGVIAEEPLSADPLVLLGMARARAGDFAGADALVRRGLSVDPRNRNAHLWMLYRHLGTGNRARAAVEAIRLMELQPDRRDALVPILVDLAKDSGARMAIRKANMSPLSRSTLMEAAMASKLPTSALAEMVPDAMIGPGVAQANGYRQLRLRMEEDRNYAGLLALWRRTLPGPAPEPPDGLYDGSFRGLPGGPPFNWTLNSMASGSAERSDLSGAPAPTGLVVTQSGLTGGVYAQQLMLLRPGAYRLEVDALSEPDEGSDSQPIHVILLCSISGSAVGDWVVPAKPSWQRVAYRFTIPAAQCPAQRVQIVGRPQSEGNNGRLSLTRMAIVRDGQ